MQPKRIEVHHYLTSAPSECRTLRICSSPHTTAQWRTECFSLSMLFTSAPLSSRYCTTSMLPEITAR